jgi:hypothetical protein
MKLFYKQGKLKKNEEMLREIVVTTCNEHLERFNSLSPPAKWTNGSEDTLL